ncbi:MAG TPA: FAD-linked oxidase C-terminal domain-containing protein [Gammaproteobacteria bacterium]|nr:FAD-linked oxidase C-terminal domain-containing protein [Gammaproteobacteria bacterium]
MPFDKHAASLYDERVIPEVIRRLQEGTTAEVCFDEGSRALYAADASNYRQVPIGVVIPKTVEDVVAAVAICREYRLPVLSRGGGTSLAGQCCNVAVVLDMTKYLHKIISLDAEARTAVVEPGTVLDRLRERAEEHHLTFAPDPSTHSHNTLGGMIGNNSCGVHSIMGGRTSENVIELDVLTYDGLRMTVGPTSEAELEGIINAGGRRGEIYAGLRALRDRYARLIRERMPNIPRRVSGFSLDELFDENGFNVARALVGTEGACVIVLRAKLRLVDSPPARALAVLGYPDVFVACDHVPAVMSHQPTALEGMDRALADDIRKSHLHESELSMLPAGDGWLVVEFGGATAEEACARAERAVRELQDHDKGISGAVVYKNRADVKKIWEVRKSALGVTAHPSGRLPTWSGWEDAAVPPARLGEYLRQFRKLLDRYGYQGDLYGHFGQGCVHVSISFDLDSEAGIARYRKFAREAASLVVACGGSLSGEHGDGQSRGELMNIMYGEDMIEAFRKFKSLWDPDWKMNPGKVVDPYPMDADLRIKGMTGSHQKVVTFFKYPADAGNFNQALLRCVGVGECRKTEAGTMCPSYMATRDEKHSTRGRAHLLFEMLKGEVIKEGWESESVKEALDLCLSCKGCKHECPVNVDMATYKAEFFHHYYRRRRRPLKARLFGHIDRWAALGTKFPGPVNSLLHGGITGRLAKQIAGIAPERELPRLAAPGFRAWYAHRKPADSRHEVMLWADTFNNYFTPWVAQAAVEVLEACGYRVRLPPERLCCGRPLYEFGFLEEARERLRRIMQVLEEPLRQGMPIVALEPACTSVFRHELQELFPGDEVALQLRRNTCHFGEFMSRQARLPKLRRKALLHMHCHHKAVLGTEADRALIGAVGLDCEIPDTGCCGMAGSFGYEREKYVVSIAAGERRLLPRVRLCDADTLIIADGFSCREQIRQATGRQAMHMAEVMQMAWRQDF